MSDDEFATVNVRRGDRTREFEVLRQKYRTHRETLAKLAADAPTERLAGEYQRVMGDIDGALAKLDELEGRAPSASPLETQKMRTSPGTRPLVASPVPEDTLTDITPPPSAGSYDSAVVTPGSGSRLGLIIAVVIVALAIIGYLIWRASSGREQAGSRPAAVIEQPATTPINVTAPPPSTTSAVQVAESDVIRITPAVSDYGTIRKGTRAVRQFELVNTGTTPLTVSVARSSCRCLYYDYNSKVAPKKKETITVTVDGSKAPAGALSEQLQVKAKENPQASAAFSVQATIK